MVYLKRQCNKPRGTPVPFSKPQVSPPPPPQGVDRDDTLLGWEGLVLWAGSCWGGGGLKGFADPCKKT